MDQCCLYLTAIRLNSEILDRIQGFLLNHKVFIYGWQNYLIWNILAFHNHRNEELVKYAKSFLGKDSANAAGAMLYLGKCGCLNDRVKIAKHFKGMNNFFLQRHALLGMQEVDYKIIKDFVSPYVLKESFGIYRSLKELNEPKYIVRPDPVRYKELINEVSFYA